MPLAGPAPAPASSKKRPRPPPAVQELLDALLQLQGHYAAANANARATGVAGAPAHAKERAALLAWFGALPLAERRRVLCFEEPAFVRLVGLMAHKAQARAQRQCVGGPRRPKEPSGAAVTRATFVVFPEGVSALARSGAGAGATAALASVGGRGGRGGRKEAAASASASASASMVGPGSVDVGLLGDEPFTLRPDTSNRRTAWGDALAPLAAGGSGAEEATRAWGSLMEHLLVLPPLEGPTAAVFSTAFLADTAGLVGTLEAASGGGFLGEPVTAEQYQALFGEAPWFRAKGEHSIGELLANKAELLLWRAWRAQQQLPQQQQAKPRQQQQQQPQPAMPVIPVISAALAAHVEEKAALSAFLFGDLSGRPAERRACVVGAFAKAVAAVVPEQGQGQKSGEGQLEALEALVAALKMLDSYQPLLLCAASAEAREGALELLLACPLARTMVLGGSALEVAVQRRWVADVMERRTAWHQWELLALLEDEGGREGAELRQQPPQQGPSKSARKKKRRRQQQQQLQQQQRQLEEENRVKPQLELVSEAEEQQEDGDDQEEQDAKQGASVSAVACGVGDDAALKEEGPGVTRQDCATQAEEEEEEEEEEQGPVNPDPPSDGEQGESAASLVEPTEEPADGEGEEEEEGARSSSQGCKASGGSRSGAEAEVEAEEAEVDYWEGEDTVVADEDQDTFSTALAPAAAAEEGGAPVPVSTETLLRDLCLKLEAEVATLRGVLATQRGVVVAAQQRPPSAAAPTPAPAYPGPYGHMAAATTLHQGGPGGGFGGGYGGYGPHVHASGSHSLSHHLEIMSDDGRGGRGAGGGGGGGYSHSPQPPHRVQLAAAAAAAGAPVVSLPRNPSGPLQAQAQKRAAASAARLPRPVLVPVSQRPQQHQPAPAADEAGFPTGAAPSPLPGADECSGFVLERRRPQPPLRSRLCDDVAGFVGMVAQRTGATLREQSLAVTRCRQVVQSLWPRAQVKAYGSFVTGLALPSSDVDLVICLPKVRKDAPAEAPGVLEGRNAIKETWQQELARRLRATPWVHPGSIRIIPHTAIPVIKLRALSARLGGGGGGGGGTANAAAAAAAAMGGDRLPSRGPVSGGGSGGEVPAVVDVAAAEAEAEERSVQLDVSIEGAKHNGLLANRVIADLLRESPALRPLVLVLKQFLKERGLMESYSGGLSSYGLVLMAARYLQEQSGAGPMDTGSLLLGFLDFYSNHFDPRTTGISVSRRCFFSRDHPAHPHPHLHAHDAVAASAAVSVVAQHRRGSLGGDGGPELAYYERARHSLVGGMGGGGGPGGMAGILPENPYRFDPLYIEDPICPGSNVGRNCFRVFQIQRAWNDAWRALDPAASASAGFRHWRQPPVAAPEGDGEGQGEDGGGAPTARRPHPSSLPLLGRVLCSL